MNESFQRKSRASTNNVVNERRARFVINSLAKKAAISIQWSTTRKLWDFEQQCSFHARRRFGSVARRILTQFPSRVAN